ncbi:hypothetical protein Tco_1510292, partial [Tanacetum coccineum]
TTYQHLQKQDLVFAHDVSAKVYFEKLPKPSADEDVPQPGLGVVDLSNVDEVKRSIEVDNRVDSQTGNFVVVAFNKVVEMVWFCPFSSTC